MNSSNCPDYLISELLQNLAAHLFYFYYSREGNVLPDEKQLEEDARPELATMPKCSRLTEEEKKVGWGVIRESFRWARKHLIEATDLAEVSKLCSALASSLDGDTSPVLPKEITTEQLRDFFMNASKLGKEILSIKEPVGTYNYENMQVFVPNPVRELFFPGGHKQAYDSVDYIQEVLLPMVRIIQAAEDPQTPLESIVWVEGQNTPEAPLARLVYCALGFLGISPGFCTNVRTNFMPLFVFSVLESGCPKVDSDLEKLRYWTYEHTSLASILSGSAADDEGDGNADEGERNADEGEHSADEGERNADEGERSADQGHRD